MKFDLTIFAISVTFDVRRFLVERVEDVDQHEEEGHQEGHSAGNDVGRNQKACLDKKLWKTFKNFM